MTYTIYVPAPGTIHDVDPGSAIVGEQQEDFVSTHIEGGRYAHNITCFEDRLHHAAGRRQERYPTSAIRGWQKDQVIAVADARYDEIIGHWVVERYIDSAALQAWIGEEELPAEGGSRKIMTDGAARVYSRLTPNEKIAVATTKRPRQDMTEHIIATARRTNKTPE